MKVNATQDLPLAGESEAQGEEDLLASIANLT